MKLSRRLVLLLLLLFINILSIREILGSNDPVQYLPSSLKNVIIENKEEIKNIPEDKFRSNQVENLPRQSGNVSTSVTGSTPVKEEKQGRCQCANGVCGCCSRFLLETLGQKACINVTYEPDDFSFTANMWLNDGILFTRRVSGKNPRPICIDMRRFPFITVCVRFYNIYFQGRNVHACLNMEGKLQSTTLFQVGFDCIRLGANGVALVKPEDGGGIGQLEIFPDNIPGEDSDENYDEDEDDDDDDDYF